MENKSDYQSGKGISTKHTSQCLQKAADDEPIFVLRAKDPTAPDIVRLWATRNTGIQPNEKISGAYELAKEMEEWLYNHKKDTYDIPIKQFIEYLSADSIKLISKNYGQSAIYLLEIDEERSTATEPIKYKKVPYTVEFLCAATKESPSRENIIEFCRKINEVVANEDFFQQCLCKPFITKFDNGYLICFYAISKLNRKQLTEKYGDWFCEEGEMINAHKLD